MRAYILSKVYCFPLKETPCFTQTELHNSLSCNEKKAKETDNSSKQNYYCGIVDDAK